MNRRKIRSAVSLGSVVKSGRWPRRFDGHRDGGRYGADKSKTLRDFRKGV
jgi:hypothetical protein